MMKQERSFLKWNGRFLLGSVAASHPATVFVDGKKTSGHPAPFAKPF